MTLVDEEVELLLFADEWIPLGGSRGVVSDVRLEF